jgi:hypothetical protein
VASYDSELPPLLYKLLAAGRWPRTAREAMSQNLRPLIALERVQLFAPEEKCIHLESPPFRTVADEVSRCPQKFWSEYGALDEISPAHSLIIGDFGLGSDAPIILDYREGGVNPPILRLRWFETASGRKTSWVRGADSFDEFADLLGLREA